ncbi:MAG TPA: hypothetical protein VH912_02535 [Streptosporangiaceae bacterium]
MRDDRAVPDIGAVRRDEDVVAALAARRVIDTVAASDVSAAAADDAIKLLRALIADVDAGAPPLPVAAGADRSGRQAEPRRRRARIIVTLSVTAMVLTTTGVAAAGGGLGGVVSRWPAPAHDKAYGESRAEPRHAEEAVQRRQFDAAGGSPESARHGRRGSHDPRAETARSENGRQGSRPPHPPSAGLPYPWPMSTPSHLADPGDLQREAGSAAQQRLDDIGRQWPAQGR